MHYAAFAGHADIVRYLLAQGAEVNSLSPNGSTPLMMAAREGQAAIATQLLGAGARGAIVNDNGENAVLWAMRNNNPDIARSIVGSKDFSAVAERPKDRKFNHTFNEGRCGNHRASGGFRDARCRLDVVLSFFSESQPRRGD